MIRIALIAALLTLAACASPGATSSAGRDDWTCENGKAFSVRNKLSRVEVFAGGQLYDLPAVVAGSGERYFDGTVEFWEHNGEAMLNGAFGGPYEHCTRD